MASATEARLRSVLHRCLVLVVAAICALLPAAARAQTGVIPIPADAPTIPGWWDSGQEAIVFADGQRLCAAFHDVGAPRPTTLTPDGGDCLDAAPVLGPFGRRVIVVRDDDGRYVEIAVVGAATAVVQLRQAGAVVARVATRAAPLPGPAAALRFYVLTAPSPLAIDELALLDTFETVQRALDPADPREHASTTRYVPRPGPGPVLRRGTFHGTSWTLRTRLGHPIVGTPLVPERRAALACATFAAGRTGGELCDQPGRDAEQVLVDLGKACSPIDAYVSVLARRAVHRVVVLDGAGRRRTVPLSVVPGDADGLRAGVLVLGAGIAIRRVDGLGADGRLVDRLPYGAAPAYPERGGCLGAASSIITYAVGLVGSGQLGAGPHTPHLADVGERLCVAIDRAPRPPAGCAIPPTDASDVTLDTTPTANGRYVVGLVPAWVALARLTLEGGGHRDVVPMPVTGQYAGTTALVAADVPGARRVIGYQLLDAAGRALDHLDALETPTRRHRRTLFAHAAPGLGPIVAALAPGVTAADKAYTRATVLSADVDTQCQPLGFAWFTAAVVCAPRRLVLVGGLRHTTDRLAVRTASGRTVAGRTLKLPAALRTSDAAAIGVVVLPADATPRTLLRRRVDGTLSSALQLPAAREQCGYRTVLSPDGR